MKVLVALKRVSDPDNANKVKVSGDGKQVTSEGLEWKLNPFDEWTLEAALRLEREAGYTEGIIMALGDRGDRMALCYRSVIRPQKLVAHVRPDLKGQGDLSVLADFRGRDHAQIVNLFA